MVQPIILLFEDLVRVHSWFLGAFAKLRKATTSFVMTVRPCVHPSGGPHGTTWLSLDGF
jgi:hypothetical protein